MGSHTWEKSSFGDKWIRKSKILEKQRFWIIDPSSEAFNSAENFFTGVRPRFSDPASNFTPRGVLSREYNGFLRPLRKLLYVKTVLRINYFGTEFF